MSRRGKCVAWVMLIGCGASDVFAETEWTLRGVLIEPETTQFSVDLADGQGAFWLPLGSTRYGVRAASYDAISHQLTLIAGGREVVLKLEDGQLRDSDVWNGESPATTAELQELAKAAVLNPRLAPGYASGVTTSDLTPPGRQRSEARLRRSAVQHSSQRAARGSGAASDLAFEAEPRDSEPPGSGVSVPARAVVDKGLNPRLWTE